MKSVTTFVLCLALLGGKVYAQNPYYIGGDGGDDDDGDGTIWWSWEGSGDPNSNGGDGSSNGFGSTTGSGGLSSVYAGFDVEQAMRYRTAHAVMAALCFVVLFPAGAIIIRAFPGRHSWLVHAVTQGVAYVLYIIAASLGIKLVQMVKIPPNGSSLLQMSSTNAHPIIGILLLAVLFLQPPLGFIHHSKFKRLKRRTAFSYAHLWLGRIAITLGIINGGLGLKLANASQDVIIAYSVVAAFAWLLWFATSVLAALRRREEQDIDPRGRPGGPPLPPSHYPGPVPPMPVYAAHSNNRSMSVSDDPSPPYTPGRFYGSLSAFSGSRDEEAVEMRPVKNSTSRSRSPSSLSNERMPAESVRRV
ncbi:uncharacterized protein F4822DRAFT_421021 [Hypoxylon trugodes]|uniref:uncharacterized protein n=1 Tax=Hypoxylon trugodes TaxID=326681 RepID=UPI0021982910|nr:uncharacterized protein F4822DRAFT_421021 [Hypoxylon trugodes]KAI1383565.1 hypothetical protein F4822DRAFT_421021 [Hypoxylon trugodes]